ncbi:hypothetical protein J5Y09_05295 [Roseomonas sp. PWR1]|uniref:Uncharacterized protein n=1 Tax=Roseomonas nitratireducens TaxID=2820810 RepID=A0ABS4ARU7_9PROT|nr:hypothetical protein [Neoroseomonas nitratireducens]MBP0463317.1 hypothetical protein [Neoroseomonas nitratireducens]
MPHPLLPPPAEAATPILPAAPVAQAACPRLGGLAPLFAPAEVADPGRLRMGGLSPLFPAG